MTDRVECTVQIESLIRHTRTHLSIHAIIVFAVIVALAVSRREVAPWPFAVPHR